MTEFVVYTNWVDFTTNNNNNMTVRYNVQPSTLEYTMRLMCLLSRFLNNVIHLSICHRTILWISAVLGYNRVSVHTNIFQAPVHDPLPVYQTIIKLFTVNIPSEFLLSGFRLVLWFIFLWWTIILWGYTLLYIFDGILMDSIYRVIMF